MSVVAAKVYSDKVIIAADSILAKGWSKRNTGFAKIVSINGMIVGGCGNAQEVSLLWRYMQTHQPETATEKDVLNFVVEFAKWKRELVSDSSVENSYLMAYEGKLFYIASMFVYEVKDYIAIGAGEDFATTALHLGSTPREAVKVACDLSCYVCEPVVEYEMLRK